MPSVVYKKSVEGFGISYIEAASYGKNPLLGEYMEEKEMLSKVAKLVIFAMVMI